jgi:cell division protein FtsA
VARTRDRPENRLRQAELRTHLQQVEKRALREAQHMLELERSYGDLEARLVHSAITAVRIDGYPVSTPVGFQGKNVEVTVFNTFAPITQVGAIETVIRELDLELAAAVAHPYAVARACANDDAWEQGAIFVDIGGGTTDVALIREGGVEGTRMFNLGGRAFTRRLALTMGLSYEEAEARKLRHSEGLLPPEHDAQVAHLLNQDVEVLLQGLSLCLRDLAKGERLPANIFVCGGGALLPELMSELRKNVWAYGLPFAREPQSRLLTPADVRSLSDTTGQLTSAQDIGPMGLANHALRIEAEDRDLVNSMMRGVLKAMKV